MLQIKSGVKLCGLRPEMLVGILVAERILASGNVYCVITSVVDGKHGTGSLHYAGQAVDLRISEFVNPGDAGRAAVRIKAALGAEFDVVVESDHMHLEYQPK
jgi:hypothetical protein